MRSMPVNTPVKKMTKNKIQKFRPWNGQYFMQHWGLESYRSCLYKKKRSVIPNYFRLRTEGVLPPPASQFLIYWFMHLTDRSVFSFIHLWLISVLLRIWSVPLSIDLRVWYVILFLSITNIITFIYLFMPQPTPFTDPFESNIFAFTYPLMAKSCYFTYPFVASGNGVNLLPFWNVWKYNVWYNF